jgi:hypothetical protein
VRDYRVLPESMYYVFQVHGTRYPAKTLISIGV